MLMLKLRFENVPTSTMGICPHREGLKFLKMSCVRINVREEYFEMHISLFSYVTGDGCPQNADIHTWSS